MKNDFNIIINNEKIIGYAKDLKEYFKEELNYLLANDLNNECGINNTIGILRYLNSYDDEELLKMDECAMDEFGVSIDILEV